MRDPDIIKLFFSRSEDAITFSRMKYGAYVASVAGRILRDPRDAEEAVQDAFLAAWNSIPPNEPEKLGAYLCRLGRNAALDLFRRNRSKKRGGGETDLALDEMEELIAGGSAPEEAAERKAITETINSFLRELPGKKRRIFVQRYWYLMSEEEIAKEHLMSKAAVAMQLMRMRASLKEMLVKEGLYHG
ncbi:MAG: sigma-70 family RNA polymerase sigma factor [Clostridiales bacterium]|nr:sigma-70 family RNA polymerase sigma factor [Clostridiales bacterium]